MFAFRRHLWRTRCGCSTNDDVILGTVVAYIWATSRIRRYISSIARGNDEKHHGALVHRRATYMVRAFCCAIFALLARRVARCASAFARRAS
jgi:hypothetical protein